MRWRCVGSAPCSARLTVLAHSLQVLGVIVGVCGLLLFLYWTMMSLIWLWAPLIGIGGVSVLLVFTSECGVYASKNCGCLVSLSNLFGLIVGGIELVVAIVGPCRAPFPPAGTNQHLSPDNTPTF